MAVILLSLIPSVLGAGFTGYVEQWASSATASSADYLGGNEPMKATGPPTEQCGFESVSSNTWRKLAAENADWIKLEYTTTVYISEIYTRQTYDGNISRIEAEDSNGNSFLLWDGANTTCLFSFQPIGFLQKIKTVKITAGINRYVEIDAVRLSGYTDYIIDFSDRAVTAKAVKGSSVSFSVGIADPRNITSARAIVTPAAGQVFSVALNLTAGTKASGAWSGTWSVPASAAEGSYSVSFEGCNDFICKSSSGVTFEVISGYLIDASADKEVYKRGQTVAITGKVKDSAGAGIAGDVSLSLFNSSTSVKSDGTGSFRAERQVPATATGENTVKITSQGTTKEIKIRIDPALSVELSVPQAAPKGEFFVVSGSVSGAVGTVTTEMFVNGKSKGTGGKNFSFNVLAEADTTVEIKARDEFGNEGKVSRNVAVSSISNELKVVIDSPSEAYWGDEIAIKASGTKGIEFDVNGETIMATEKNGFYEIRYNVKKTSKLLVRASGKGTSASKEILVKEPEIRIERAEEGIKATLNGFPKDNLEVYVVDSSGKKTSLVNVGNGVYKGSVNGNVRVYASGEGKRGYGEIEIKGKYDYSVVIFAFVAGVLTLAIIKLSTAGGRRRRELEDVEKRMKSLQDRYFKGEIDKDSYESVMLELEMKKEVLEKRVKP